MTNTTKTKLRKALMLACCAMLLVAVSVGATVAYLNATTGPVTNTFSVGNVTFDDPDETLAGGLDETDVDVYGKQESDKRVTENTYKLVPNHIYTKDPTVHIGDDSEDAWLFVKVVNPIAPIEAAGDTTIAAQMAAQGWTLVDGETNVYAYKETVSAGDDIVVFNSFTIKSDIEHDELKNYAGEQITVQAYIVQADNFNSAAAAWTAAPTNWTVSSTPDNDAAEGGEENI